MDRQLLAWAAFLVYVGVTTWLAWLGMKKTRDMASYALGNQDMGPLLVGITLASSVASTATFVINPGFVFKHGISALLHFGVAALAGVVLGLVVLSKGFRAHGTRTQALTLPHWLGARFASPAMRTYFALLNLLLAVSFIVLIIKSCAVVMQLTLGIGDFAVGGLTITGYQTSVFVITAFVFSYIMMGGTYAHAYTNAFQGALMVVVALIIFGHGLPRALGVEGGLGNALAAQDPNLLLVFNPTSGIYTNAWEVFFAPFIVAFGLVCQPHILMKALYLKSDRDVNKYLVYSTVIGLVFALLLLAGLFARVEHPELASLPQDSVMAAYLTKAFSGVIGVLISIALLAAGMSTLDGVLLSASTIAGNDLFLGALGERLMPGKSIDERQVAALAASRWILVGIGVVSFALALNPPLLVGIFAQVGIYGLIAASLAPIALGIFVENLSTRAVFAASVVGPLVHFAHYLIGTYAFGVQVNPAVSATEGIVVAFIVAGVGAYRARVVK